MRSKLLFLILLVFACSKANAQPALSLFPVNTLHSSDKWMQNSESFRKHFLEMRSRITLLSKSNHHQTNPARSVPVRVQNFPTDSVIKLDSTYNWQWNNLSGNWILSEKTIYTYTVSGNVAVAMSESFIGSVWVNSDQSIYTFDANNNVTNELFQLWNGATWVNNYQDIYIYNLYDSLTNYTNQTWNGSAWQNNYQYIHGYDFNHNMTSEVYQNWTGSSWINNDEYLATYDANHNRLSWIYQQWVAGNWENNYEYLYTYNVTNYVTSIIEKYWDIDSVNWMNSSQTFNGYDGSNNLVNSLTQLWDGLNWFNDHQYSDTFDGSNNMTSEIYQIWDGLAWKYIMRSLFSYDGNNNQSNWTSQNWDSTAWLNNFRYNNAFDGNDNRIYSVYQSWNSGAWVNSDSTFFYYSMHVITDIAVNILPEKKISIYPNPATTQFKMLNSESNISAVQIYDLLGQEIFSKKTIGSTELVVDVSAWQAGIYFLRVLNDQHSDFKNYRLEIVH